MAAFRRKMHAMRCGAMPCDAMRRDVMCCAGSRKLESFHEVFARGTDIVGCSVPDAGSSKSGGDRGRS